MYNFDDFVASYRSPAADAGISTHYAIELEVKEGVVMARSKKDICPETPWSSTSQLFPPVVTPRTRCHAPTDAPTICELQPWKNVDKIRADLTKFYGKKLSYRVTHIPDDVAEGMFACMLDCLLVCLLV